MATTPNNLFGSTIGGAAIGNPNLIQQGINNGVNNAGTAGGGRGFVNPGLTDVNQAFGAGAGRGSANPTTQSPPNVASAPKPSTSNPLTAMAPLLAYCGMNCNDAAPSAGPTKLPTPMAASWMPPCSPLSLPASIE